MDVDIPKMIQSASDAVAKAFGKDQITARKSNQSPRGPGSIMGQPSSRWYRRHVLGERNQRPQRMAWPVRDQDGKMHTLLAPLNRAPKRISGARKRVR